MSDDLVKRLREDQPVTQDMASTMQCVLQDEAADRIEKLEAQRDKTYQALLKVTKIHDEVEAKLAKAVSALQQLVLEYDEVALAHDEPKSMTAAYVVARATLAELKGGKDA